MLKPWRCVRNYIQTQDTDLLTHAVAILATKGWERSESASLDMQLLMPSVSNFKFLFTVYYTWSN